MYHDRGLVSAAIIVITAELHAVVGGDRQPFTAMRLQSVAVGDHLLFIWLDSGLIELFAVERECFSAPENRPIAYRRRCENKDDQKQYQAK